jgi:dihydrofolate reductase
LASGEIVTNDADSPAAPQTSIDEEEMMMGRLIVSAQMTMDSVMDQLDGWFDAERESEQHGVEELRAADALVLGRETYEGLAAFWPTQEGAYAELVNPIPKYVASRTIQEPLSWNSNSSAPTPRRMWPLSRRGMQAI